MTLSYAGGGVRSLLAAIAQQIAQAVARRRDVRALEVGTNDGKEVKRGQGPP